MIYTAEDLRVDTGAVAESMVGVATNVTLLESEMRRLRHPSKLAYEANLREALRHLERARESLLEAASHLEQT